MAGAIGIGALSYVGYGVEATPGVPAQINDFLFVTANSINANPDVIRKSIFGGNRSAEQIIRTSKFKIGGGLTHPLYSNSGAQFAMGALGMDSYLAPVAGVAYTGGATANGMTTFVTTDPVTPGAWAIFGTGATQEPRQLLPLHVLDPVGFATPNTWGVAALSTANRAATGTFDQAPQHKFSNIPPTMSNAAALPSITLELNELRQYAWRLPGSYVGKYDIKGGKEDVEITSTMHCTEMPTFLGPGAFTAFAPTQTELDDIARPFDINDGYVIVPAAPGGASTSALVALSSIEDWEVNFDNGVLEKAFWDGGQVYKVFPGIRKTTVKYRYAISAGRPDAYDDFLSQLHANYVPFVASMALNVGSPSAPSWYTYGLYAPSSVMTKADLTRAVNDVLIMNVEADALVARPGDDQFSIFVMNSSSGLYAGTTA